MGGHFALGALNALANGGSGGDTALSGAAAAGAEMAIPQLAQRLYGTSDPDKLTAEQKANLKTAAALLGTAVGGAGGNAVNTANAGSAAENALGNNWLSTSQLIDIDKRYHDCGTDERCKQDVIYTAQLMSHSQDTDLTVAKVKCFFTYCDRLDQYIGERVKAADLNIAYKELKKYYPNATEEDLRNAAKYYSDEAVRSFDTSTGRTLIGALDASPAVGLAGSGVREATSAIKPAFKNGAARAALRNAEVTAAEAASCEAVLNSAAHGSPTAKELASIKNAGNGGKIPVSNLDDVPAPSTVGKAAQDAKNIKAGSGNDIFLGADIRPYHPKDSLYGQNEISSCVAGSCRMALQSITGNNIPESYIRQVIKTDVRTGTAFASVDKEALKQLEFNGTVEYFRKISIKDITTATNKGAFFVANIKTPANGYHAVVVDYIKDGRVYIRAPWPQAKGSSYSVSVDDFIERFAGNGIMFND